jgi:UDP-glucuronate 4-epimerase
MIIVTGAAGFIGMHVCIKLLELGESVVGIDNLNDYYDVKLKYARLKNIQAQDNFSFYKGDISDKTFLEGIFLKNKISKVINLAAQAGVRYSLINPSAYIQSNIVGFANILELCKIHNVEHLVYASSSSVYGANKKVPFSEFDNVDFPVSFYAATKKSNELMAHSYSHIFELPTTGLRFFTVYGPWGRPDMSPWLFTSAILDGKPIKVFNHGDMMRDFTYIDDIVEGVVKITNKIPEGPMNQAALTNAPYHLYNIGNNKPVKLMEYIKTIEEVTGVKAELKMMPMQPGDMQITYANIDSLEKKIQFKPDTLLSTGITKWVNWYKTYHGIK